MRASEGIAGLLGISNSSRPRKEGGLDYAKPGSSGGAPQSLDLTGTKASRVEDDRVDPGPLEPGKGRWTEGAISGHAPELWENRSTLSRVGGGVRGKHCHENRGREQP
jgi:hypothetical protein